MDSQDVQGIFDDFQPLLIVVYDDDVELLV